mmetsp:Transcript_4291/g.16099  ORF Transcript_4291/g.16099 Transcript_4291/m.16099 type:complete len:274 (+) Transcript_4291:1008-1829(+)
MSRSMPSIFEVYTAPHSALSRCKISASAPPAPCDDDGPPPPPLPPTARCCCSTRLARSFLKKASKASFAARYLKMPITCSIACSNSASLLPTRSFLSNSSTCLASNFAGTFCEPAFKNASNESFNDSANSLEFRKGSVKMAIILDRNSINAGITPLDSSGASPALKILDPARLMMSPQAFRKAGSSPTSSSNLYNLAKSSKRCPSTSPARPESKSLTACAFTSSPRTLASKAGMELACKHSAHRTRSPSSLASQCSKYSASESRWSTCSDSEL